jgi:hypothetical protein
MGGRAFEEAEDPREDVAEGRPVSDFSRRDANDRHVSMLLVAFCPFGLR